MWPTVEILIRAEKFLSFYKVLVEKWRHFLVKKKKLLRGWTFYYFTSSTWFGHWVEPFTHSMDHRCHGGCVLCRYDFNGGYLVLMMTFGFIFYSFIHFWTTFVAFLVIGLSAPPAPSVGQPLFLAQPLAKVKKKDLKNVVFFRCDF